MDYHNITSRESIQSSLNIQRGFIVSIGSDGIILVESKLTHATHACRFLQIGVGVPSLIIGDEILFLLNEGDTDGYVIGAIRKPLSVPSNQEHNSKTIPFDNQLQDCYELRFDAKERIELRCGTSSITLQRNGKIILKGVEILSRAAKQNKIKGAVVRIN
jgi:hypothetical protein